MAAKSVTIFLNECLEENRVRTFGGCGGEVISMAREYKNMTKETFIAKHPKWEDKCKDKFKLYIYVDSKHSTKLF